MVDETAKNPSMLMMDS